jgi:hypothetical protein
MTEEYLSDTGASLTRPGSRPFGLEPAAQSQPEALIPRAGLTKRAAEFVRINRTYSVVSGTWLDKDGRRPKGGPETWAKMSYRLDNGQQFTLNEAELAGLKAIGFRPVWWGDRFRRAASAMSTGTAKAPQAVEGRSPASAVAKPDAQEQ